MQRAFSAATRGDPPAPPEVQGDLFSRGAGHVAQERDQLGGCWRGGAATTVATPPSLKHPKRRRHRNNVHFSGQLLVALHTVVAFAEHLTILQRGLATLRPGSDVVSLHLVTAVDRLRPCRVR